MRRTEGGYRNHRSDTKVQIRATQEERVSGEKAARIIEVQEVLFGILEKLSTVIKACAEQQQC